MNAPIDQKQGISSEQVYEIARIVARETDWKEALDSIAKYVRPYFVFDNLVLYSHEPDSKTYEVVFARATGRGRSAEADVFWGEAIVNQVQTCQKSVVVCMSVDENRNRLANPTALGVPICVQQDLKGVLVFIRFGGPDFSEEGIKLAEFIALEISWLAEQEKLQTDLRQLETQNRQARLQEDFISTITHELRNPLGFIKGYTTTLLRSDTTWDQATQQEFLQIIDQETDRLQELIENLLDSARLQAGELHLQFQHVRLDALVNTVITRTRLHHPSVNIQAVFETSLRPIQADPRRLTQVLENLIGNAVKYAPDSEILVKINQDEVMTYITVQDFGPGIPEEYQQHLFERFFRVPNQTVNVHGSGLGLHICKKLVQAHNGEISVQSSVGSGTSFIVSLPV